MYELRPRVLVAEDDPELRRALTELLEAEGMDVLECCDGGAVKELIDDAMLRDRPSPRVEACILDLRMPEVNGEELLAHARRMNWRMPMILMTAYGDDEIRRRAKAAGAVAYFAKPIDVDALLRELRELLAEPSRSRGASPPSSSPRTSEKPRIALRANDFASFPQET